MKTKRMEREFYRDFNNAVVSGIVPEHFSDDARLECELAIDDSYIRRQFQIFVDMVDMAGLDMASRQLYHMSGFEHEFLRLQDLVYRRRLVVEDDETPVTLDDVRIDGRWTVNTAPGHIRSQVPGLDGMSDAELLERVGFKPKEISIKESTHIDQTVDKLDSFVEELQSMNRLIKVKRG